MISNCKNLSTTRGNQIQSTKALILDGLDGLKTIMSFKYRKIFVYLPEVFAIVLLFKTALDSFDICFI